MSALGQSGHAQCTTRCPLCANSGHSESDGLQQSGRPRIRFLQKQGRKLFVFAQEFFTSSSFIAIPGWDNRPKMSGSDKRKKRQDILEAFAAKGIPQHFSSKLRLRRVQQRFERQSANNRSSISANQERAIRPASSWPPSLHCKSVRVPPPRRRCLQKLDHLLNGLRLSRGVARCGPIANKQNRNDAQCRANRTETREEEKSRSLKSVGIGLSKNAAAAKPHSLSIISGASGVDTKKLGTNRKRLATC